MAEQVRFMVEDETLAEFLGVSNFSNAHAAILEIVKNAYDAGAPHLTIEFADDAIIVTDDGKGMNESDIRTKWLHVGVSEKRYAEEDENGRVRVQSGSKGVGRFALARLGSEVVMRSKARGFEGVEWRTDWRTSKVDVCEYATVGTRIEILRLRDSWTKKSVDKLIGFLSRSYCDDAMKITVMAHGRDVEVPAYFNPPKIGFNCTEVIRFSFDACSCLISVNIESDEFMDDAQQCVGGFDIHRHEVTLNAVDELAALRPEANVRDDFAALLETVGSFDGEMYFAITPTKDDAKRFMYKYTTLPEGYPSGLILYRNAFSIVSYEGSKDWLGFGRRARKSPAGIAHPTGSWRVRENQIAGMVRIDKEENRFLTDLANRQGLEENDQYEVFVAIIDAVLQVFERYRQGIVRSIANARKENASDQPSNTVSDKVASGDLKYEDLTNQQYQELRKELKDSRAESRRAEKHALEAAARHRYDVRILNVLATSGLKASSIAHELRNDETNILNNSIHVREALESFGYWDELCSPERTALSYKNVPLLLEEGARINAVVVKFMSAMLGDIQKDRFAQTECELSQALDRIVKRWEVDYPRMRVSHNASFGTSVAMPADVVQVVFDNLLLNSIQQNPNNEQLLVEVDVTTANEIVAVRYHDNGVGLDAKYHDEPRRILEVHETTRKNGHGLGMWIVNNSLMNYNGAVSEIATGNGFSISFEIKAAR